MCRTVIERNLYVTPPYIHRIQQRIQVLPQFFGQNRIRLILRRPRQPVGVEIDRACADGISTHGTVHLRRGHQHDVRYAKKSPALH